MYRYEEFVNYYRIHNLLTCAKTDILNYVASGIFWFWLISMIGFVAFFIGAISKGILSIVFTSAGLPLFLAWTIYVAGTPNSVSWRQQITDYLDTKYKEPDWENFLNYITTQYVLEDSKPLWRTSYGVTWLSLAIGQLIGLTLEGDKLLNHTITSIMVTSAITIIAFLFFLDNVYPRRKTRLHLAIKDIKNFQTANVKINS